MCGILTPIRMALATASQNGVCFALAIHPPRLHLPCFISAAPPQVAGWVTHGSRFGGLGAQPPDTKPIIVTIRIKVVGCEAAER